jgi:ParB family chromosome partitioning protein
MPELKTILLSEIDEPPLAIRLTMDDEALRDLGDSIRTIGLQQPITVIQEDGRYRIVTGHRRYIAHQRINRTEIMCLVRQPGEVEEIAAMVHENILREDVNPAEEAIFYARLVDEKGFGESQLMDLTHRSAEYIGDRFKLLRSDEHVFEAVRRGDISFSTARELNRCDDDHMRRFYLDNAVRGGHASRIVKRWVDDWRKNQANPQPPLAPVEVVQPAPAPEPEKFCCVLCGGYRDPWNFVTVTLHKFEWDAIQRSLREGANGTTGD